MGSGSWTTKDFATYTGVTKGMSLNDFSTTSNMTTGQVYRSHGLNKVLNPKNVMRECRDSEEHPNTFPIILALDVTGSMGDASVKVAQKLNDIMTNIYADESIKDVEFCVMGIGDVTYDREPIQMSQFESDIRIAEQLDAIYFEGGGGSNKFESYTAAWYMGVNHCDLDCWKRGRKGVIITIGDELPNPSLAKEGYRRGLAAVTGDMLQDDVETSELLNEVLEKFNVYHISVDDNNTCYRRYKFSYHLDKAWSDLLGAQHYKVATLENLSDTIAEIVKGEYAEQNGGFIALSTSTENTTNNEVSW